MLTKIRNTLEYLSPKDLKIGERLILQRNFEALYELVDSTILKTINNKLKKEQTDNIKELLLLKSYLETYINQLNYEQEPI